MLILFYQNGQTQGFNSIHSSDNTDIIAVGNIGNIFRSFNGGNTWNSYIQGSANLNSVHKINNTIWIAGDNGTIYKSTDNGTTWNQVTTNTINDLNGIQFISDINGLAAGDSVILRTTNGGITWNSTAAAKLNAIKYKNANEVFACGLSGTVLMSTNGGLNWTSKNTGTTRELLNIDALNNHIIATGADGFIITSTNNGDNWVYQDYNIETFSMVNDVHITGINKYYTCGGGGFIRKTTDGGLTFSYQQNPMMADLKAFHFYNDSLGWAVSSKNNAILKTTDGGITWTLPAGTTVSYQWTRTQLGTGNIGNGFYKHPSIKEGVFIMMGNNIYRSLNKGENWTQIASCTIGGSAHSFYVNKIDTNIMLCSKGSSGAYVCRSTNYGQTWSIVWGPGQLTSYGMPLEADPNNPNIVYLAPDNDSLMKSTDYGLTWTTISNRSFRSPCDIAVNYLNSDHIYLGDGTTGVGAGEFFKSTNGGISWTSIHTVTGSEIPMIGISSLDTSLAYHSTWSSGGLWKTTNKFQTYQQLNTLGNLWAVDIAKDDPTAVAFDNYGPSCYISTNSGVNYTTTSVGSSPAAGMYFFDKGNLLAQHGGGVYKLYVTYSVITSNNVTGKNIPDRFFLAQNFPNPFNPVTNIEYSIPERSNVKIVVYDVTGHEIATLLNDRKSPGTYSVQFDAIKKSSGIYFYSLIVNNFAVETKKMVLIK